MIQRLIVVFFFCLTWTSIFSASSSVYKSPSEQHIGVVLRMIGHQILLKSGDSTSRVLPISHENSQYKISFNTSFAFAPEVLAKTVNDIIQDTKLSEKYRVEIWMRDSNVVVYSYEVGKKNNLNLIPCSQRSYPEGNYYLLLTLLDLKRETALSNGPNQSNNFPILVLVFLPLLVIIVWWLVRLRPKKVQMNSNLIQLGEFQFDERNMTLLLKEKRIELSGKESELLLLLYKALNTTVEKEVLLHTIWGDDGDYVGRTLDVFISKLRKKLEFDPNVKILNIRGVGYKLVMSDN